MVKHLDPDELEAGDGLQRLLEVLRKSPLQQLLVPDMFKRLDAGHHLQRQANETIPELLVREKDLFVQLQQSSVRARQDRNPTVPCRCSSKCRNSAHESSFDSGTESFGR